MSETRASQAPSQSITPELRAWIVAQAQSGFSAQSVLDGMLAAGWQEDVAIEAMESTLRDHLAQTTPCSSTRATAVWPCWPP